MVDVTHGQQFARCARFCSAHACLWWNFHQFTAVRHRENRPRPRNHVGFAALHRPHIKLCAAGDEPHFVGLYLVGGGLVVWVDEDLAGVAFKYRVGDDVVIFGGFQPVQADGCVGLQGDAGTAV